MPAVLTAQINPKSTPHQPNGEGDPRGTPDMAQRPRGNPQASRRDTQGPHESHSHPEELPHGQGRIHPRPPPRCRTQLRDAAAGWGGRRQPRQIPTP